MRNDNYLSLINFKLKLHRLRLFFFIIEPDPGVSLLFCNVVNVVTRGLLERHVGRYDHGATWGSL